jgi:hypothetical protein
MKPLMTTLAVLLRNEDRAGGISRRSPAGAQTYEGETL